jgi:hypothetical protein
VLEKETEQIVGAVGQRTIGQSGSITLREILAADILPALKAFFRADVEALLLEEHRAALRQTRFNHDHPDVKGAQAALNSALVMHFPFPRKEYLSRLADAVHLLTNYLVRPQWTLNGVVFEKEPAVTVESLRRILRYFSPYEYLPDVLFRYAEDRKISAFTKQEFSALLWKIDAAWVARKSGRELADALLPAYEFFRFPRTAGAPALPVRALIKFFEDKGLTDVQTRLEGEMAQGLAEAGPEALAAILEDVRRTAGRFTAERTEQKTAGAGAEGEGAAPPAGASPAGQAAGAPGRDGGARTGPDIAAAIPDGERKKFVRKIFRQEDSNFTEAVAQLSRMTSWKDASRYIDEIFITNDVDPYSGEAERFIEIVFQQYHPPR